MNIDLLRQGIDTALSAQLEEFCATISEIDEQLIPIEIGRAHV